MQYYQVNNEGYLINIVNLEFPPMVDTGEFKINWYETLDGRFEFKEPILIEDPAYVKIAPPIDLKKPKWNGEGWVEGASKPTELERLESVENALMELIIGGK
ncbi:hypothetical protein BK720_19945 [Bacillus thuringiensis serovar brasilensis]|uniref:hypothetical protein n=1 Tax=Bacillus cereus group TaxID=86661 RepID=UPI000A3866D4|nr:hypothetical protein [Bacillus thuringiensis]MCU5028586.1 hypothetical protein [Bacillus cereus]MRA71918.1 hypothetical protein [Bacillus thuringiensis]MRA91198.1 hypothetical protein [Bacillus thuringiensis]MRC53415.1 hypothetical protein [Bacillus thuringiensis]OTX29667.1 hypothetical protein BK720_19945 [Bacillus thuringiensis serovar brasilensis]